MAFRLQYPVCPILHFCTFSNTLSAVPYRADNALRGRQGIPRIIMDREEDTSTRSLSPRRTLSALPERDNEYHDSDEEENDKIETSSEQAGEAQPDPKSSHDDHGHGWLVTFIARRITVSRSMWSKYQWSMYQHKRRNRDSTTVAFGDTDTTMRKEPPRRGIFFMPLVSPYNPICLFWMTLMLLFDLTYTVSAQGAQSTDSFHTMHSMITYRMSFVQSRRAN